MRRALWIAALPALAGAFAWVRCSIYDSTLLQPDNADAGDAEAPDVAEAGVTDADTCPHARPPPPPAADDPSDGGEIEVVVAVRALDLGFTPDGGVPPVLGYDLDGLCTCPGPEACKATSPTAPMHCDDPGGRDNSGGGLLRTFSQLSGGLFTQDSINQQIAAGQYGLLVRVRHYNGQPNDKQVELSLYVSDGTPIDSDAGTPTPPKWDGTDVWTVDALSVFGGTGPPYTPIAFDLKAYVSGGVLVGSLDYDVAFGFSSIDLLRVNLVAGVVTAKLTPSGTGFKMDQGQLAGRWAMTKLFAALLDVHDPASTTAYLCPTTQTYTDLKALACPAADITADPKAQPSTPCDAMSLALGFNGVPASFGSVQKVVIPSTCSDAGADKCN